MVSTLVLEVPDWPGHLAGQHVDIRLTAADGYQAQRSYSIASTGDRDLLEVTVQHVEAGEVSPFLVSGVVAGDTFEVRGPIGDYFTWTPGQKEPLLLVAGGSGIVPLMAIIRTRHACADVVPIRLLYSVRDYESLIYREELESLAGRKDGFVLIETLTRRQPGEWKGEKGRIDQGMLRRAAGPAGTGSLAFVCGPTPLVEAVSTALLSLGFVEARIKTERFGPT